MDIESFRIYCLNKKGVSEGFPFDQKTLVFKVMDKMFALVDIDDFISVNLKCDPLIALELRAEFIAVKAGFHMNKKHWNTVEINRDVEDSKIYKMIDHSYDLVVKGLTKKVKEELNQLT